MGRDRPPPSTEPSPDCSADRGTIPYAGLSSASRSTGADHETGGTDYGRPYLPPGYAVLVRPVGRTGYELVLSLAQPLGPETLKRLATETDLTRLIELALSLDEIPSYKDCGITSEILAALEGAGLVIVPRLPTTSMLDEAWAAAHEERADEVWREMIEAWESERMTES